jgi:broad specificity phosphatase PhoE
MKTITVLMTRHGKSVNGQLEYSEISRARYLGEVIFRGFKLDYVTSSPLPRAIHTAFAVTVSAPWLDDEVFLRPTMSEFGSDAMFAEMTAPEGFRARAAQVGNCTALWETHSEEKVRGWQKPMVEALEQMMGILDDGSLILHVSHSPSIELCLQGFAERNNFLLPEGADNIKELESIVIEFQQESESEPFEIKYARKISAPMT